MSALDNLFMTVTDGHSTLAPDRPKKFVLRYTVIGFEIIASATKFRNEIQIYPFLSFICDLGGSLGLFVGFSFLTLWDFFDIIFIKFKDFSQYHK